MKQKHKVAVILPAFNEEKRLKQVLTDFKRFKFPLIVVDDGSKDRTSKIAKNYADIFLKHQVNLGKGAALKTGCEYAFTHGFSAVVLIDADGQHASGDLPGLVEVLQSSPYQIIFWFTPN
jgi:glycosyltransferase involved in cell wall biosynthesis